MLYTEPRIETARVVTARATSDGSPAELPLFVARPGGTPGVKRPALLLIQEIFGVNPHIQDVVQRFAGAGYVVVAPDIFYRTDRWLSFNYDQFSDVRPIVGALTEELVIGDLSAALDFLAAQPDVDPERIGAIGYCFGGRMAYLSAARLGDRVKAAAIYYGGGLAVDGPREGWPVDPLSRAKDIKCPVMGFFGALDKHILPEHVQRIEAALTEAGVPNAFHLYPYADHGFFCDARATFHPRAAQDAWVRTLRFFEESLGPVPAVEWK